MAGATVRGITLTSSGCALAAISVATAIVLITLGFGIARSSPEMNRMAPPVIDVRHADLTALSSESRIRPGTLAEKAARV
jgi:hypothetical protein